MKTRRFLIFLSLSLFYLPLAYGAYGYGEENALQQFFDGTGGVLVKVVGSGVFLWGLATAFIQMSTDERTDFGMIGRRLIAGAGIFLSKALVNLMLKLTNFGG